MGRVQPATLGRLEGIQKRIWNVISPARKGIYILRVFSIQQVKKP